MMKSIAALLLAFCMLISVFDALASEITEEHFPGYFVQLRSNTKDLSKMAKSADWKLVNAGGGVLAVAYPSTGSASRDGFTYEGEKATFFITVKGENGFISEQTTITGSRYAIDYQKHDAFETALKESLEWLEAHFGASPVANGKYLLLLGDDLVEVYVRQLRNKPRSVSFEMDIVENVDQALNDYGYQSLEDVPTAPWKPIGIAPEE